jgi:alcohol dehydrogenase
VLRAAPALAAAGAAPRVLVVGAGTMGQLVLRALQALSPATVATAVVRHPVQRRLAAAAGARVVSGAAVPLYEALAADLGTTVIGRRGNRLLAGGYDVVFDMAGTAPGLHHALRWTRPAGTIVVAGVELGQGRLDRSPIVDRELTVAGAYGFAGEPAAGLPGHGFAQVSRLLAAGRLDLGGLVTHRLALASFRAALDAAADRRASGAVKVVLAPAG